MHTLSSRSSIYRRFGLRPHQQHEMLLAIIIPWSGSRTGTITTCFQPLIISEHGQESPYVEQTHDMLWVCVQGKEKECYIRNMYEYIYIRRSTAWAALHPQHSSYTKFLVHLTTRVYRGPTQELCNTAFLLTEMHQCLYKRNNTFMRKQSSMRLTRISSACKKHLLNRHGYISLTCLYTFWYPVQLCTEQMSCLIDKSIHTATLEVPTAHDFL
jgi:hypothetical protein